jgi:hypothetical protein
MTQQPSRSGPDPIGDFQRWIVRSGARSVSREVSGHVRSALGLGDGPGDVWDSATRPAEQEAPECAWCPFCRAARVLRESGPGVSAQVAAATDALTGLMQDAMSAVESALAAGGRMAADGEQPGPRPDVTDQHPGDEPEPTGAPGGPPHEPDDRG